MRPTDISEGNFRTIYSYDGDGFKLKAENYCSGILFETKYYLGRQYEYIQNTEGNKKEIFYLDGDPYTASAIYIKEFDSNDYKVNYLCRDHLGSITHVLSGDGNIKEELSYDAWGRLRNPETQVVYAHGQVPKLRVGRGYTGHEHLLSYGLINMNARLYDPVLGRFLSPDPYVQNPFFSQNFNRYSYCLNNPLIYTDPDGEFFLGYTFGFFKGLFTGKNPFKEGWKSGINEIKIWGGLFASDPNKGFWGRTVEIISRITYQLPQTLVGIGNSLISNLAGQVDKVDYWGGTTVLSGNFGGKDYSAVTLGSYICGTRKLSADPHNSLFQHEYGHYLQSLTMGTCLFVYNRYPKCIS